jgi:Protein of unknown function (DUF664)
VRIDPDPDGSESVLLGQYLDYQRETMLSKTDGLTQEQLALKHAPSELTLVGLLYHLALVEEDWKEVRFSGLPDREPWVGVDWDADPNWEFRTACQLEPDELRRRYRQACARSREAVAEAVGLDQLSVRPLRNGERFSLRWYSCTSSRRQHATPATPTSSANRSTAKSASSPGSRPRRGSSKRGT